MGNLVFTIIGVLVAAMDINMAFTVFGRKNKKDIFMGLTLLLAGIVVLAYIISAKTEDYFTMSLFSSFYFSGISAMVISLMFYVRDYIKMENSVWQNVVDGIAVAYMVFDIIVQMINPFKEISIHFNYRPGSVAMWEYAPKFLFHMHLIFCYIVIAAVFSHLTFKIFRTPHAYRQKYIGVLAGVFFVVLLNGIFVFLQDENVLDYSVMFYSIIGFFIFWNRYYYSTHGMLTKVRQMILDELDHPVMLFDDSDELAMCNELAKSFVNIDEERKSPITINEFAEKMHFPEEVNDFGTEYHFQWIYGPVTNQTIYRVDLKRLRDKKNRTIGKLIVMTDNSLEMDLLTGFHSKNSFEGYFRSENVEMEYPVAVAICDLNMLSKINKESGENQGDLAIQELSQLMVKYFPKDSYFARLEEANLVAVCPNTDNKRTKECLTNIRIELQRIKKFCIPLEMQSAVSVATENNPGIIEAAETALFSMRSKKLMDGNSAHSSLMDSLAQTLLESDNTTRAHVARTRDMGELLGKRLGLTDSQQSDLSLLCLLHDIGKLGIPLEILNKPGKLTPSEWDVMKSHVEKGYRIAKASPELEEIADLILHHHEAWNGKGYPDGLQQESIPLLSRIIAVIDTYDAMTNDRPYHHAVSDLEAREELRRCAGIQFDPTIVQEFLSILEELHPAAEYEEGLEDLSDLEDYEPPRQTSHGATEIFESQKTNESIVQINYAKYITNEDSYIVTINDKFTEITGYTQEDLDTYKLKHWDLIPKEDMSAYIKQLNEMASETGEAYIEHRILRKDGVIRDVICFGKQNFNSVTRKPQTELFLFDVLQTNAISVVQKQEKEIAKRTFEKYENLFRKDSLTGLLNHEAFINDVEVELLKKNQKIALLILDVDYFKNYNDSYGHFDGDKMLSLVAVMLENAVKEQGFAGRLGGDEFAAILRFNNNDSDEFINESVEKCFNMVMNAISTQKKGATISMGVAKMDNAAGFNVLYQAADHALYRAKERGRKCYSF